MSNSMEIEAAAPDPTPLARQGSKVAASALQGIMQVAGKDQDSSKHTPLDADTGLLQGPGYRKRRSSMLSETAEKQLAEADPDAHAALTATWTGVLVQVVLLTMAVSAYVGNPILVNWAKTVDRTPEGEPVKATAYMEVMVIFFMKLIMSLMGLSYALYLDFSNRGGSGENEGDAVPSPWENIKRCFNFQDLKTWNWVALGWTVADIAEQMANGRVDAATYTVLSQLRLVGTAVVMRLALGVQRSTLQWQILVTLCLTIIGWKLIPNELYVAPSPPRTNEVVGLVATLTKIILSVTCGVYAQGLFQGYSAKIPFVIAQAQVTIMSTLWMLVLVPLFLLVLAPYLIEEPWWDAEIGPSSFYGFFGGVPYCKDGIEDPCEKVEITSWSYKVFVVLAFNVYRDYTVNFVLKVFDALVKNLCNALATIVAYYLAVGLLRDIPFNSIKGVFSVVIALEIMNYGAAGNQPPPPTEKEGDEKK